MPALLNNTAEKNLHFNDIRNGKQTDAFSLQHILTPNFHRYDCTFVFSCGQAAQEVVMLVS